MDRWDLTPLYTSFTSPEFLKDMVLMKVDIEEINALSSAELTPLERVEKYITIQNRFQDRAERLIEYAALRSSVDTGDDEAIKHLDTLENILTETTKAETAFAKWLSETELSEETSLIKEHTFFLDEIRKEGSHLLSPEEESVFAKMRITGSGAFTKLWENASADLMAEIELDGEKASLPIAEIRNLAYDADPVKRKTAYEAELKALETIASQSAAALNAIKGEVITETKLRNYVSPLKMTLEQSRMDEDVLYPMLEAMKECMPAFRKYFKCKASLLGHKGSLPFYELFAPIGNTNMTFTIEEAKNTVCENFLTFSESLSNYAKTAFDENWIDIYPRKGKRGGAFCCNLHSIKQSRFLTNFTGSLSDVITFAHELGHGYHGHMLNDETAVNSHYPMPIAETASTFCETIVKNALLKKADKETKLFILENDIADSAQIVVDILSRFIFEDSFFRKRTEGPLSPDEISSLMIKAQEETYGDGLDKDAMHKYMWVIKPHYYDADYNYYNFPYAFGLLFAKGLYAEFIKKGPDFAKDYDKLLSLTGKSLLKDLALPFGIDITKKEFWQQSLKTITDDIETFLEMTE